MARNLSRNCHRTHRHLRRVDLGNELTQAVSYQRGAPFCMCTCSYVRHACLFSGPSVSGERLSGKGRRPSERLFVSFPGFLGDFLQKLSGSMGSQPFSQQPETATEARTDCRTSRRRKNSKLKPEAGSQENNWNKKMKQRNQCSTRDTGGEPPRNPRHEQRQPSVVCVTVLDCASAPRSDAELLSSQT